MAFPALAQASTTQRLALVVGNNLGADLAPLHYAEEDAAKMARVLTELGGVAPADLTLLRGGNAARGGGLRPRSQARLAALRQMEPRRERC